MNSSTKSILLKLALSPYICLEVLANVFSFILNLLKPGVGNLWEDRFIKKTQEKTQSVTHKSKDGSKFQARFYIPNEICRFRAKTFSTKEPETLAWIDEFGGDGALFDIGANIGLYSIYYASTKRSNVYAFEPSFLNLPLLVKHIHLNKMSQLIKVVSNPLSNINQFGQFSLSSIEEGGALSAFGVDYGYDGNALDKLITYQTLGFTLDYLFEEGILKEHPKLIKIDVDGIEHLIVSGAKNTLSSPSCKTVLIEVTDSFTEQADGVKVILEDAGFTLKEKLHSEMLGTGAFSDLYNQIWVKS